MAGLTLAQAEEKLFQWLTIDTDLQSGQTVRFGERLLTRADSLEVRNNIEYWNQKCQQLGEVSQGRKRSRTVMPLW